MSTVKQDADFIKEVIPTSLLELALDWIANNMEPEDVFDDEALSEWAMASGFVKEES